MNHCKKVNLFNRYCSVEAEKISDTINEDVVEITIEPGKQLKLN